MINSILQNIKQIRISKNITQQELAKVLGMTASRYNRIELGKTKISIEDTENIANALGLSLSKLISSSESHNASIQNNITFVPVSAEAGILNGSLDGVIDEPKIQFSLPSFEESDLYMVLVQGNSMSPTIDNGSYVIIKEVDTKFLVLDKIYLLRTYEGNYIKRICKVSEDTLLLRSDNTDYNDINFSKNDIITIWEVKGAILKF